MTRRASFFAPIALAALSVVIALSIGRVVDSSRFVAPVVAAALLPHALGAVVRWRSRPAWVFVVVSTVALAAFVVLALEWPTTTFGVPSGSTWRAIDAQLTDGWNLLRTSPAPAPATDGAILLAVIAVWATATLADWLAFVRRTTLAATTPALVFFIWTSTLGTDSFRLLLTVAFCLAAGAFVVAQHVALLDQRRSWLVSRRGATPHWLGPAALLGTVAVLVAVVVTPFIPGAGSDPLLDVGNGDQGNGGGHSYEPTLAPFVDIGQKLESTEDVDLFTVESPLPDYWRIAALDSYSSGNGGQWTLSAEGDDSVRVGLPDTAPEGTLQQRFRIGDLGERWLPAAYRPVAIDLPDTLEVLASGTLVADADSVSGLDYIVASKLPPLAGTPLGAEQIAATTAPVPDDVRSALALPKTSDTSQIAATARGVVDAAGATTPYARAAALRDFFRDPQNGFVYDTSVSTVDNGSAILEFLKNRRGFCVQFASAYAVMARSLGIPARVAVGFTPGTLGTDGRYHVSSHDAHAWPEIYLSGLGWTHLFDPTPGRSGSTSGGSALPGERAVAGTTPTTLPPATTAPPTTPSTGASPTTGQAAPGSRTPVAPTLAPTGTRSGPSPWRPVVVALLAVTLLAGAYVAAVLGSKHRRRERRRHAAEPEHAVTGAWEEALDRLHESAVAVQPEQTPRDLAAIVPTRTNAGTAQPIRALADAYGAARYGRAATAVATVDDAWASLEELERALDDGVTWRRRWRRKLDPTTFLRR